MCDCVKRLTNEANLYIKNRIKKLSIGKFFVSPEDLQELETQVSTLMTDMLDQVKQLDGSILNDEFNKITDKLIDVETKKYPMCTSLDNSVVELLESHMQQCQEKVDDLMAEYDVMKKTEITLAYAETDIQKQFEKHQKTYLQIRNEISVLQQVFEHNKVDIKQMPRLRK